jgi:hypothetical protein
MDLELSADLARDLLFLVVAGRFLEMLEEFIDLAMVFREELQRVLLALTCHLNAS